MTNHQLIYAWLSYDPFSDDPIPEASPENALRHVTVGMRSGAFKIQHNGHTIAVCFGGIVDYRTLVNKEARYWLREIETAQAALEALDG